MKEAGKTLSRVHERRREEGRRMAKDTLWQRDREVVGPKAG